MMSEEKEIEIKDEPEQDSEEPEEKKEEKEEEDTEEIAERIDRAIEKAINKRFPQKKAKTTPKHIRGKGDEESDSQIDDKPICYRCHNPLILTQEGYYLCVTCKKLYNV